MAYSARSEHPAHGPIGQVWGDNVGRFLLGGQEGGRGDNVGRFYMVGAKLRIVFFLHPLKKDRKK